MTKQIYKTAQGKVLDMGKLMIQNEQVRAVGNMKVNARGDHVDDDNKIIKTKKEQVSAQYKNQVTPTVMPQKNNGSVYRQETQIRKGNEG